MKDSEHTYRVYGRDGASCVVTARNKTEAAKKSTLLAPVSHVVEEIKANESK